MLNPIASFSIFLSEMLIAYLFFSEVSEKRCSDKWCMAAGLVLCSICSIYNLYLNNNAIINGLLSFLTTILFAVFCFNAPVGRSIFFSAVLVVLNTAIETLTVALSATIIGVDFFGYNNNQIIFLFEAIICKSIYFLFTLLISKWINASDNSVKIPFSFFAYPVFSLFCLLLFWYIAAQPSTGDAIQLLLAIASGGLFVSSMLLFITYAHNVEKDRAAMQLNAELSRLQTEQSYYQILEQQNQQLMLYVHDTKKHLAAIHALNENAQISGYIQQLSQQLQAYSKNCHSGNKLLDVMIHKYEMECKMQNIPFEYDVRSCNLTQLEDIDLVAILGNLMDNALAAAQKTSDPAVSLSTVRRNCYSVIILTNSCEQPPKQSGKWLLSSKPDPQGHGYGLKSVERTAHKYQGDIEWQFDADAKQFTVTVMIADST